MDAAFVLQVPVPHLFSCHGDHHPSCRQAQETPWMPRQRDPCAVGKKSTEFYMIRNGCLCECHNLFFFSKFERGNWGIEMPPLKKKKKEWDARLPLNASIVFTGAFKIKTDTRPFTWFEMYFAKKFERPDHVETGHYNTDSQLE